MNYEAIKKAMQDEINKPQKCYMPNSPGSSVRDRLFKECEWESAVWFWQHYCWRKFGVPELDDLYIKLELLAANEKMPDWGTRGT